MIDLFVRFHTNTQKDTAGSFILLNLFSNPSLYHLLLSFSINMLLIKHLIALVFTAQWLICSNGLESKCYTISLLSFTSDC